MNNFIDTSILLIGFIAIFITGVILGYQFRDIPLSIKEKKSEH